MEKFFITSGPVDSLETDGTKHHLISTCRTRKLDRGEEWMNAISLLLKKISEAFALQTET